MYPNCFTDRKKEREKRIQGEMPNRYYDALGPEHKTSDIIQLVLQIVTLFPLDEKKSNMYEVTRRRDERKQG